MKDNENGYNDAHIDMGQPGTIHISNPPILFKRRDIWQPTQYIKGTSILKTPSRTSKTNPKIVTLPPVQHYDQSHLAHSNEGSYDTNEMNGSEIDPLRRIQGQDRLLRVTAYCTAEYYNIKDLFQYIRVRGLDVDPVPVMYEEALYMLVRRQPKSIQSEITEIDSNHEQSVGHVFVFEYGVAVFWELEEYEEKRVLLELKFFEAGSLEVDDIEIEEMKYTYSPDHVPRIINDIIYLKSNHHMFKLSISHAIAQSAKIGIYEEKINNCIGMARSIPLALAKHGTINMTRRQISKKIGELFDLRINVNLVLNVLDVPEIFWSKPSLEPFYVAARNYLEISQRVLVLNQKCEVISDMLDVMREQLNSSHSQKLEWIVIILIFFEILIALFTGIPSFYSREK